jgi:hypothetical protein
MKQTRRAPDADPFPSPPEGRICDFYETPESFLS